MGRLWPPESRRAGLEAGLRVLPSGRCRVGVAAVGVASATAGLLAGVGARPRAARPTYAVSIEANGPCARDLPAEARPCRHGRHHAGDRGGGRLIGPEPGACAGAGGPQERQGAQRAG